MEKNLKKKDTEKLLNVPPMLTTFQNYLSHSRCSLP